MKPEIMTSSIGINRYRIVSPFCQENTYVMTDAARTSAVVTDPGVQCYDAVKRVLIQMNCRVQFIILTHEHYDHIGSMNQLRECCQCQVVASPSCSSNIMNAEKNLSAFYDSVGYVVEPADILVGEQGTNIPWGPCELHVFRSPGHSEECVCVHIFSHLFTGDTMIKDERTVTKLPGGSGSRLMGSLEYIFTAFSSSTVLLPGHGESMLLRETSPQIHYPYAPASEVAWNRMA